MKKIIICIIATIVIILSIVICSDDSYCKLNTKKMYSVTKKSGSYVLPINVKIKANKGYKLYHTDTKKFTPNKVIKSGKTKKFSIKKDTVLALYPVKNSTKLGNDKVRALKYNSKKCIKLKYTAKKGKGDDSLTADGVVNNNMSDQNLLMTEKPNIETPRATIIPVVTNVPSDTASPTVTTIPKDTNILAVTKAPSNSPQNSPIPDTQPTPIRDKTELEQELDDKIITDNDNDKWISGWY